MQHGFFRGTDGSRPVPSKSSHPALELSEQNDVPDHNRGIWIGHRKLSPHVGECKITLLASTENWRKTSRQVPSLFEVDSLPVPQLVSFRLHFEKSGCMLYTMAQKDKGHAVFSLLYANTKAE